MTRKLIKTASKNADFIQKFEIGKIDDAGDIAVQASDPFDLGIYIEYCDFTYEDDHITVKIPVEEIKRFTGTFFIITVIAIQDGNVCNPVNCEVQLKG